MTHSETTFDSSHLSGLDRAGVHESGWRLAASTLGVVDEDLRTILASFCRYNCQAAELRSAEGALVHPALTAAERRHLREAFSAAGVEIFAIASKVRIASDDSDDSVISALSDELRLAADLGATFVRVFPGAPSAPVGSDELPHLDENTDFVDARAVRRLTAVNDLAQDLGVSPVLETHDSHPRGEDIARILTRLDEELPHHLVGAIWDVLHPWRVGEDLDTTGQRLMPYIRHGRGYVQIKDVRHPADTTPVLQGEGRVPLPGFLGILARTEYTGPVSLEWERFWYPHVPPLDEALEAAATAVSQHPRQSLSIGF